jgi:tRNA-splicing ligase RtcB
MKAITENGNRIKLWTDHVPPLEDTAMQQLKNVSQLPFIHKHVACMPDGHWGNGACVGSVIATKHVIIPAAVGVDLGCGMGAVKTNLRAEDLPDSLSTLRSDIEAAVPHGRTSNGGPGDQGAWGSEVPKDVAAPWSLMQDKFDLLCADHPKLRGCNTAVHLGTLGTGNHFIEVCLDESDAVWVMLHSGSRGVGNRIGSYFISKAKEEMERWHINLPDYNLAYLPEGSEYFGDYVQAVRWAQQYALVNREIMMARTLNTLEHHVKPVIVQAQAVNCHHNYVSWERHFGSDVIVTRKGALRADDGMWGIIPGAMGKRSYIVQGKGNRESFMSCSHGAGRLMSRTQAKKTFTLEDHARATLGVECRKDEGVLDETPGAYKDIDAVMRSQEDLVDIRHTLSAVLCVKG